MELAPGLKHSQSVKVTGDMTPQHLRGDPIRVLATPEMVRLIEQTAIQAVQPLLKPDQTTVGTRVDRGSPRRYPGGGGGDGHGRADGRRSPPAHVPRRGPRRGGEGERGNPRALRHRGRTARATAPGEARRLAEALTPVLQASLSPGGPHAPEIRPMARARTCHTERVWPGRRLHRGPPPYQTTALAPSSAFQGVSPTAEDLFGGARWHRSSSSEACLSRRPASGCAKCSPKLAGSSRRRSSRTVRRAVRAGSASSR